MQSSSQRVAVLDLGMVPKVFNDDPFYEIWGEDFQTIDDAKKAIDNGELPQWENLQLSSMLTASTQ